MNFFRRKRLPDIRVYGDPALKCKAKPIGAIDDKIRRLAEVMFEVMTEANGLGLAGPQIGIGLRIVVLSVPRPVPQEDSPPIIFSPGEALLLPRMPMVLINPELSDFSEETEKREEGCLSVPEIYAPVTRPSSIVLRTQTLSGESFNVECGGLLGRALQHEIDHLNGRLFVELLEDSDRKKIKKELFALKKKKNKPETDINYILEKYS